MQRHNKPMKNGLSDRIRDYVLAHEGCTPDDIARDVGVNLKGGMLTYCKYTGRVFSAGPRNWQRYYSTAELARAADTVLRAEFARHTRERIERNHKLDNAKKKAVRHATGSRAIDTRPKAKKVPLPPGSYVVNGIRMVIAPAPKDMRFTVESVTEPMFSLLGIGRYLSRDTAIQRALSELGA